jgi:hypothetical protein
MSTNTPAMPDPDDDSMGAGILTPKQVAMYEAIDKVEDLLGGFEQDAGPDGAHYSDVSPWAAQGIRCANCISYMNTARACHWVEGEIKPDGICKLWVIPGSLIAADIGGES